MEKILLTFQTNLGSISHEILTLQQESVQMNVKLKNRQAVRGELSQFVDDMVVPEEMILLVFPECRLVWGLKLDFLHSPRVRLG